MGERTSLGRQWAVPALVHRTMRPLVWADPRATIGGGARLLEGAEHSCVLVRLPSGLGIVTDHDFRRSLAEESMSREAPLSAICSVPVVTVTEHTDAPTALLVMVEQGIHHLVVTADTGDPVGVVRVVDLASAEVRDPLLVRRLVQRAQGLGDLVQAASILPSTALELAEVGTPALRVTGILSAVRDLVAQRVIELTATSEPSTSVSWLVLGSSARREAMPGSDIDTALAWPTELDSRASELRADAGLVLTALERCGLSRCPDGANATEPLFSRSLKDWEEATRRWTQHPESESALLLASIVADNRALTSVDLGRALTQSMLASVRDRPFLDALLTFTLAHKPPLGRIHDFTVEHTGDHRGQVDLKHGGLWPVVLLGRWIALVVGEARGSTVDRIRRGSQAGILTEGEAEDLIDAFEQIFQLRFDQEIAALQHDAAQGGHVTPGNLDELQRNYLRDSLRAITRVQTAVRKAWARGEVTWLEMP
jgi:CBS domain-containing protein